MRAPACHPSQKYFARDMCKPCYKQWWSENNRDKTRAAGLRYKRNHPELCKSRASSNYWRNREEKRKLSKMRNATPEGKLRTKDQHMRKRYGVGLSWYEETYNQQDGACAICGDRDGFGGLGHNLRVDHDHSTNKARGLLCNRCNTGLGYIENKTWFEKAAEYLAKHDGRELRLIRGQHGNQGS